MPTGVKRKESNTLPYGWNNTFVQRAQMKGRGGLILVKLNLYIGQIAHK